MTSGKTLVFVELTKPVSFSFAALSSAITSIFRAHLNRASACYWALARRAGHGTLSFVLNLFRRVRKQVNISNLIPQSAPNFGDLFIN